MLRNVRSSKIFLPTRRRIDAGALELWIIVTCILSNILVFLQDTLYILLRTYYAPSCLIFFVRLLVNVKNGYRIFWKVNGEVMLLNSCFDFSYCSVKAYKKWIVKAAKMRFLPTIKGYKKLCMIKTKLLIFSWV